MSVQTKFIIAAMAFLIPVFTILLQRVFYFVGKYVWVFLLPKLRRTSKLRYYFIEIKHTSGGEYLVYVQTGIVILYMVFVLVFLVL
jgi:hypothetical protein